MNGASRQGETLEDGPGGIAFELGHGPGKGVTHAQALTAPVVPQ
ncbi:hypothetical protein [Paenibacillus sp. MY03]|nr:hypothetical protein [Paenibacillus sp. MY03]